MAKKERCRLITPPTTITVDSAPFNLKMLIVWVTKSQPMFLQTMQQLRYGDEIRTALGDIDSNEPFGLPERMWVTIKESLEIACR